jgi:transcriptional regulator with XRE-family HTH domain
MKKSIGKKIVRLRLLKTMSQEELYKKSGIRIATISNIENGCTKKPHPSTLKAIADALGCKVSDLQGD